MTQFHKWTIGAPIKAKGFDELGLGDKVAYCDCKAWFVNLSNYFRTTFSCGIELVWVGQGLGSLDMVGHRDRPRILKWVRNITLHANGNTLNNSLGNINQVHGLFYFSKNVFSVNQNRKHVLWERNSLSWWPNLTPKGQLWSFYVTRGHQRARDLSSKWHLDIQINKLVIDVLQNRRKLNRD